jgi:hypothetical protein
MKPGETATIQWSIPNILVSGRYTIALAVCDESKINYYDWFNEAGTFNVNKDTVTGGLVHPKITTDLLSLSGKNND